MRITFIFTYNGILKNSFLRIRPYEAIEGLTRLIEAQSDFSFPSGHSASSFAGAVVIYKMVDKKYGMIAIIFASFIAFSRLYVGVHYPTDVLVGIVSGTCIALFVVYIFKNYHFLDTQ